MRLLHLINDLPYWFQHRAPIAAAARRAGWSVTVAAAPSPIRAQVEASGTPVLELPIDRFRAGVADVEFLAKARDLFKRERFDVVHLFTIKPLLIGGLAARSVPTAKRARVIGTVAGLGRGLSEDAPGRRARIITRGLKAGLGAVAAAVTFENPEDAASYVARGVIDPARAIVLKGAGIDIGVFAPDLAWLAAADRPADRQIDVVFASRLVKAKGVLEFAEAARLIAARWPGRARFRLAGYEAPGEPDGLTAGEIAALKADPAIDWLGRVAPEAMPGLMRRTDIFVLPTRYPEGLPRSCLEAGACGAAVVAGDVAGTRALIDPGRDGLLLPDPTGPALADAIGGLIMDTPRRRALGVALRHKIETEGYALEAITGAFLSLYGAPTVT
jgi:glycosyltransferase involved in cell wall biosynthesis